MLTEFKSDESGRLKALGGLNVLDSGDEQPFEHIVTMVEQILKVPMCAVSLVDKDRQWFKARRGLDVCETARDISFCTHAIKGTEPFIVPNALLDARFATNPLVTGAPHIRSYAGIPLMTPDGYNIGSLCAIDNKPREFSAVEVEILKNFAKLVVDELELRQVLSTDQLTGAMARAAWFDVAAKEVTRARRYDRALSLLVLDIDHFKSVNDQLGHTAGDAVLRQVAQVVLGQLRQSDVLGRFGGEEFVVLLPETVLADAAFLAERVRKAVAQASYPGQEALRCTISIGVAELSHSEQKIGTLFERADNAVLRAKTNGRDRVEISTAATLETEQNIAA